MTLVETGIRLTIAGEAEYRSGIKSISNEMKSLQTQSKLAMAQLGNNASITDKYRTSQKNLSKELELVKTKSTSLKNEQEKLSKVYTELPNKLKQTESAFKRSSRETERLEKNYKEMKKVLDETHPEVQKVKQAWEESKSTTKSLKEEYTNLSREVSETEKELSKLPDQIAKTELASQRLTNQMQKEHEMWRNQGGRLADTAKKYQEFGNSAQEIGGKLSNFGSTMTNRFTLPIATGFGLAAKQAATFQTEIGQLGPLIAEGGNITAEVRKEMDLLGESSREWAIDYGKSTSEINTGMAELIRNGYNSGQVLGMLPNILDASIASGEEFGTVMGTTANVLSQFQLKGKDTNETLENTQRVVDSLTYVANATSSGFYDLGEGMAYVGPVANTLNMSVEETASLLGILSDNGIEASKGGTALRGALSRLLKPSKQNSAAMAELGISTEDYKNGLIDFPTIIDTIAENTKNLTNEQKAALIAQAFGTESQSAMNALVNAGGDALRNMTKEAEGATGATKEIAEAMKELPEFKFQQSLAQLRDLGIELGNKLLPVIMDVTETATDWVQAFTEMDDSTQDLIIKSGLLLAAIGPVASVFGNLTSVVGGSSKAIGEAIKAYGKLTTPKSLTDMGKALDDIPGKATNAGNSAAKFSGPWLASAAPIIAGLAGIGAVILTDITQPIRDHKESVKETEGAYQEWFDSVVAGAVEASNAQSKLQDATEKTGETYREAAQRIMNQNSTIKANIDSIFEGGFFDAGWSYRLNGFGEALVEYESLANKLSNLLPESEIKRIEGNFNSMTDLIGNSIADIGNTFMKQTPVTATWAKGQVDAITEVAEATKRKLVEQREALLKSAQDEAQYHQNSTQWLSQETSRIEKEYSKRTWIVNNAQNTIQTILQNASKQNRALTEQEMASLTRSFQDLSVTSGRSMSDLAESSEMIGEALRGLATDTGLAFMEAAGMIDSETAEMIRSMDNAEDRTKALAEALDEYDQIKPDPKLAEVETSGEEELQRIVELFGADWASLTDEEKTALVNAEGYDELSGLLYEWGIWKADGNIEAKKAAVETDEALANFIPLFEQTELWNNTQFLSKLAYIDTNGPEAKEQILALVSEWSGIPLEEVKSMLIESETKGAEESKQKVGEVKSEVDKLNGTKAKTEVNADTKGALEQLFEIIQAHESINDGEVKKLIVQAESEEAQNKLAAVIAKWAGISEAEAKQLLIDAQTELANQKLSETENKKNNLATPTNMTVSADTLIADGSLTNTKVLATELGTLNPNVSVSATDNASPIIGDVALGASDLEDADPNVFIMASDNTNGVITAKKEEIDSIPDSKSTSLSASIAGALAGAVGALSMQAYKQSIEEIPDNKTTTISVNANGISETSANIKDYNKHTQAMVDKSVTATTGAPGLPSDTNKVKEWNEKVKAMRSNSSKATTSAPGLPKDTNLVDKWNNVVANMKSNSSTATTSVPNIVGNTNAVRNWISALNSTYSKTSTLTTYVDKVYRTFGRHAEGGHIGLHAEGGNIQWGGMFANGGNVPKGYMGIVGEAGPELFHVTRSGVSITPLASSEKMRGVEGAIAEYMKNKGGNNSTNINVEVSVSDIVIRDDRDIDQLAKVIGQQLHREVSMNALFRKGRTT
ncbi:phage tail tape measure protein [Facklamia sp. P13069]|uniref:phage tail tape measure protein n=1 Tax=Facklamia sp. P13069 TaxID=3421954 RepID=UPI003D16AAD4